MGNKLHLENQICFPFYAISRNITKRYTPYLAKMDLTYPQYLVLLVLWKEDNVCIKDICKSLWLEINTISPMLNTLVKKWIIIKKKYPSNNKQIHILLTDTGKNKEQEAQKIPHLILNWLDFSEYSLKNLHTDLISLMKILEEK